LNDAGITQEQIDVTRLATEHQMLADLKQYTAEGGDLEAKDHNGATFVSCSQSASVLTYKPVRFL
jgi:hypothetical protein